MAHTVRKRALPRQARDKHILREPPKRDFVSYRVDPQLHPASVVSKAVSKDNTVLQENGQFLSFPYVCPEPVLAPRSLLYINGSKRPFSHLPAESRRFSVGVFLLCSVCPEPVLAPRSCFNRKNGAKNAFPHQCLRSREPGGPGVELVAGLPCTTNGLLSPNVSGACPEPVLANIRLAFQY